ncbi:MAG TPA: ATP-binding protein [Vicinamibacteria bacterium]|jgi:two-component system nitrogen regulation sensor histidine kinase NtrY
MSTMANPDKPRTKKEFKDNPRLLAAVVALLAAVPIVSTYLIGKSQSFSPGFLARVFLYGFTVVNLTVLLVLVFVLARNLIKLFIERRRAVLGAKFKTKLVMIFVGFALFPSALIILVGSRLISTSVELWFNQPVETVLLGSQDVVESYYREKQESATFYARMLSNEMSQQRLLAPTNVRALFRTMESRLTQYRLDMINVFSTDGELVTLVHPGLPLDDNNPDAARRLAEIGLRGQERLIQDELGGGALVRYVSPIYGSGTQEVIGAVVVSHFVPRSLAATLQLVNDQANDYRQAEAQKEPIQELFLSFFVMVSLLVLFSSTWIGLYLAKRITVPVRELAEATERIMAGDLDHAVGGAAVDELGMLMESFNKMTAQLKASQLRLERSSEDLELKNSELDRRRRYIETVLENITTGIISMNRDGILTTVNPAALRMLELEREVVGRHYRDVFGDADLAELEPLLEGMEGDGHRAREEEVNVVVGGRELHLSVYLTMLTGAAGEPTGLLMVLDDLTQLLRAQKVAAWREVARRLAHEIKNPLTPIQLSAQRIRKHARSKTPELPRIVEECTGTIIDEVDSLKNLVDEFSQFARMPTVATRRQAVNPLLEATLELYDGLFKGLKLEKRFAADLPELSLDPDLIRRVFINIIDNAIEATSGKGHVVVTTSHEPQNNVVVVEIADDGPGIPPEDRDKLFVPYYSTKRRGSGLGLAIVSRIVAEHRGRIRVESNEPRGSRFILELPVAERAVGVGMSSGPIPTS